jgi:hypothetical protein
MTHLAQARTLQARIISRRPDGSGGVVEVPIIAETPFIDFSMTEGGGPKEGKITREMLQEMDRNFAVLARPVKVGTDHQTFAEREGVINYTRMEGDVLWAGIDMGEPMFSNFALRRLWQAFSMEGRKNLKRPTQEIPGWVLTGGIFTNEPATDSNFRIAASAGESSSGDLVAFARYAAPEQQKGDDMAEDTKTAPAAGAKESETVSLTFHESKLAEQRDALAAKDAEIERIKASATGQDEKISALTAERNDAQAALNAANDEKAAAVAKATRLEAEARNLRQTRDSLQIALTEKEQEVNEQRKVSLSSKVEAIVNEAIDAGVPPAAFYKEGENPADWMDSNFVSEEAFEKQVAQLKSVASGKVVPLKDVKSGHDPKAASDPERVELTEKDKAVLSKFGLGKVDYRGVSSEAEAKLREEQTAAKSKE